MKKLSIDLETRSGADIKKCGVYRYAEDPNFDVLLFGVSIDDGPVTVYDLAQGEQVPEEIVSALTDDIVIKWAYNCSFERVCLSAWMRRYHPDRVTGAYLDPASWRCSLIWGAYNGLPQGLDKIGAVLGFDEDKQKMKEGRELVKFFCVPCRPTIKNGGRTWNLPRHDPAKWELFKQYNRRDVEVEIAIQERLRKYPVPESVWQEYVQDQRINDCGIMIDRDLVRQALAIDEESKRALMAKMQKKTQLDNPNSVLQLREYLSDNGLETESLGKADVAELLKSAPPELHDILSLRLELAKSSTRKYQAMENAVCSDDRLHGMFQFYGASRSGRWAGRLVQLQNLPANHRPDLEEARQAVKQENYTALAEKYDSVPSLLSELIRTAFVPKPGYQFFVADYAQIEARVLAHLAGEKWRADVFRSGHDIYAESASRMFGVPVKKNGENGHLRQRGKIAELALGYGGSVGALVSMGAVTMGIPEEDLKPLVDMWREANPHIVQFWWAVDAAAKEAIRKRSNARVGNFHFEYMSGVLFVTLPSGRKLAYAKPRLELNKYGTESITYLGQDANKHWGRIESYGPKLTENIVQAVSRDILAAAMMRLQDYRICGHVHDELIIEAPPETSLEKICAVMGQTPDWLPGIELQADGYRCGFYMKA